MRISLNTALGILALIVCTEPLCLAQTAPTTPAAPTDQGVFSSSTSVVFTWNEASDPGSDIASYNCRVGTSPNGSDIFSGNVGNVLSTTITGVYGQCYYCSVQAVDNAGNSSNWSASSNGITVVQWPNITLDLVKGLSDNSSVGVSSKTVTAIFATGFYVEEQDRSSGILVVPSGGVSASLTAGSLVTVGGVLQTKSTGERYLVVSGHLDGTWTYAQQNWNSSFGLVGNWPGVGQLGIGWVRCGGGSSGLCNWPGIETRVGSYNWTASDADLAGNTAIGVSSLPILCYSPTWATADGNTLSPPSNLQYYADFVTNAVTRYQYDIKAYDIWNEANTPAFFNGDIIQYTNLLKTAYTAAKLADPSCQVVYGGSAGVDYQYLNYVYERGGKGYFDIMSCHPYQWGTVLNDSWFVQQLTSLRSTMNAAGDTYKPIWLTEFGWSTDTAGGGVTVAQQAQLLAQTFVTALTLKSMGVNEAFWYNSKDWPPNQYYGLMNGSGTPKTSFTTYKTVINLLSSTTYMGAITLASGVRCYAFQAADGTGTLAIWAPTSTSITLPTTLVGTDVSFKNYLGAGLMVTNDGTNYYPTANAYMMYVIGCSSSVFSSALMPSYPAYTPGSSNPTPNPVWASIMNPTTTERAYMQTGTTAPLQVYVQNQGTSAASGTITCSVSGLNIPPAQSYSLAAGTSATLTFSYSVPSYKTGLLSATVTGTANGVAIAASTAQVRMTRKNSIEFAPNAGNTELQYLSDAGTSACSSCMRFGGYFTYKFNMTGTAHASLYTDAGANAGGPWAIQASKDNITYTTVASGNSWPDWRTITLDAYTGGNMYVKYIDTSGAAGEQLSYLSLTSY